MSAYGEGCPHACEYCEEQDRLAEEDLHRSLREYADKMLALPEGDPSRVSWERQLKWLTDAIYAPSMLDKATFEGPVKFTFWDGTK